MCNTAVCNDTTLARSREHCAGPAKQRGLQTHTHTHKISPINRVVIAIIIQIALNQTMEQSHTIKKKLYYKKCSELFP
jgi:hypothetical protein